MKGTVFQPRMLQLNFRQLKLTPAHEIPQEKIQGNLNPQPSVYCGFYVKYDFNVQGNVYLLKEASENMRVSISAQMDQISSCMDIG